VWQFLIFVLVWLSFTIVFAGVLALGTLWLQGYFYTEPTTGLLWRGPAAGAALALLLTVWCLLSFLSPGDYDTLWSFSPRQKKEFPEIQVVRGNDTKTYRKGKNPRGQVEYMDENGKRPPEHSDEIIVNEDGTDVHFKAERWTQGPDKGKVRVREGTLHYIDEHGREMSDNGLGRLDTVRWGRLVLNLSLNFFHLVLWFVCLWLLLRFQWAHALGLAVILWLVMTIPLLPIMLGKAAELGREQAKQKTDAGALLWCATAARPGSLRSTRCA
jgi:hypothetical protein